LPWLAPASAAGFRYLAFGFESGSDRVVGLMHKGHDQAMAQMILEECRRTKLRVEALIMFGYPTETEIEATQTIEMLARNADALFGINLNAFTLDPQSPIGRDPAAHGLIPTSDGPVTVDPDSYTTKTGITQQEALRFVHQVRRHPRLYRKATLGHSRHEMRLVESLAKNMESVDDLRLGQRTA
jgi:hypothetical protein